MDVLKNSPYLLILLLSFFSVLFSMKWWWRKIWKLLSLACLFLFSPLLHLSPHSLCFIQVSSSFSSSQHTNHPLPSLLCVSYSVVVQAAATAVAHQQHQQEQQVQQQQNPTTVAVAAESSSNNYNPSSFLRFQPQVHRPPLHCTKQQPFMSTVELFTSSSEYDSEFLSEFISTQPNN